LIDLARKELNLLGLKCEFLSEGYVVRVEKAYPVYDNNYLEATNKIKHWLNEAHPNWFQIGRNGQHHYNNQDHSMLTAYHAVRNYLGLQDGDFWNVNLGNDYHEEITNSRQSPIYPSSQS
jgi:hypothetical protein